MTTVKSELVIDKPIREIFTYMASPHNGPAFVPNLSENTNIFPEADGVGQKFDWRFNMAGVDMRGKAEITEYDAPNKVVISSTGDADSNWIYELDSIDENSTNVSVEIEYNLSETVLQRIANNAVINKIAQKTTEQMLDSLKLIMEA